MLAFVCVCFICGFVCVCLSVYVYACSDDQDDEDDGYDDEDDDGERGWPVWPVVGCLLLLHLCCFVLLLKGGCCLFVSQTKLSLDNLITQTTNINVYACVMNGVSVCLFVYPRCHFLGHDYLQCIWVADLIHVQWFMSCLLLSGEVVGTS